MVNWKNVARHALEDVVRAKKRVARGAVRMNQPDLAAVYAPTGEMKELEHRLTNAGIGILATVDHDVHGLSLVLVEHNQLFELDCLARGRSTTPQPPALAPATEQKTVESVH